jgi:chemotaxis protein CheD
MDYYRLNMGDVVVSSNHANYTCFGLGSCIGLFIQDRVTGFSGGAHILLPENDEGPRDRNKFYNATTALGELLNRFTVLGSNLTSLRAKVVGGSNVVGIHIPVGKRNSDSVISLLITHKIFIAALDVGGSFCRTAKFQSDTGQLTVWMPQINEFKIY